jgi:hypothetical protein
LFSLIILVSCSRHESIKAFKSEILRDENTIYLDIELNYAMPDKLKSNLGMFSYCKQNLNLRILNLNNKLISSFKIERIIKYDRWNNYYLIKDSYNLNERKLLNFEDIKKTINIFNKIPFKYKNSPDITKSMKLEFDYYLKSVDFVEPFKFIEYTKGLGNIKDLNNKYEFYVEN